MPASLAAIQGDVFVKSTGGANTLAINDSADGTANTYNIIGSQVTASTFPAFIDFSGGGITTLDLTSPGAGDTFNFTGPVQSGVTTYNFSADSGPGPNTLNVTSNVPHLELYRPRESSGSAPAHRSSITRTSRRSTSPSRRHPRWARHDHHGDRRAGPEQRRRGHLHRDRPRRTSPPISSRRSTGVTARPHSAGTIAGQRHRVAITSWAATPTRKPGPTPSTSR